MNKNVSLAIEKAVSNLDKIENNDLKELNNNKSIQIDKPLNLGTDIVSLQTLKINKQHKKNCN